MRHRNPQLRILAVVTVLLGAAAQGSVRALGRRDPALLAAALCRACERLGPAFVKLGQFLSVRPDLLPPALLKQFELLQDRAAPFSSSVAAAVVQRELGAPLDRLFREFDPTPIASASLSQVHQARLQTREVVAVKVQRPGAEVSLRGDLRLAVPLVKALVALTPLRRKIDAAALWREVEAAAARELDFRNEAEVAEAMARNFRHFPGIRIPRVHWGWTTARVLTTDFIRGTKISDAAVRRRDDYRDLAERGARAFLKQVLEDGIFHADLHPANLLITPEGEIAYVDFGIAGRLAADERHAILGALAGLVNRDADLALRHLAALGVKVPAQTRRAFVADVGEVMDRALGPSLADLSVGRIGWGILAAVHRHGVLFPRRHVLLLKALMTIEGTARMLHPLFCFEPAAREFLATRTRSTLSVGRMCEAAWRALSLVGLAALPAGPAPVCPPATASGAPA